jgi:hypothetical protein
MWLALTTDERESTVARPPTDSEGAMNDTGSVSISVSLSRSDADEFLRRISEDDEYRDYLQRDPPNAFAEHGITVSGDAVPDQIELPPKEHVNWLFRRSDAVEQVKPPMPTFASCLVWGIWMIAAAQASENPPETPAA